MSYQIRIKPLSKVKVSLGSTGVNVRTKDGAYMAQKFEELTDVNLGNVGDGYIIMYDAATQKYTAVDPDSILVASASTTTGTPGIPTSFINALDIDLDNRIDLDAGTF